MIRSISSRIRRLVEAVHFEWIAVVGLIVGVAVFIGFTTEIEHGNMFTIFFQLLNAALGAFLAGVGIVVYLTVWALLIRSPKELWPWLAIIVSHATTLLVWWGGQLMVLHEAAWVLSITYCSSLFVFSIFFFLFAILLPARRKKQGKKVFTRPLTTGELAAVLRKKPKQRQAEPVSKLAPPIKAPDKRSTLTTYSVKPGSRNEQGHHHYNGGG